ncbi:hypothetical protein [Gordonia aichiensis]|nr:hypothetical protein [Gordonia aichiensis]
MKHTTEHGYLNRHVSDTLETIYDTWAHSDYVGQCRHAILDIAGCDQ